MKTLAAATLTLSLLAATPVYNGAPDTGLADAFIGSGGGSGSFSSIRAFNGMIGPDAVLAAERDLGTTGGANNAAGFVREFDYAVTDAWTVASRQNVKLGNAPATSGSAGVARSLVSDGTTPDGTFDISYLFAHLFTPAVATQVMHDVDTRYGDGSSAQFTQMGNRFFSDVASDVRS